MNFSFSSFSSLFQTARQVMMLGCALGCAVGLGAPLCFADKPAPTPTIQTGYLMAGTRYQTPFFIQTGALAGPTIVVIGGLHGDEPAGYLAARELKRWQITRGTLVLVPDSNRIAIEANQRFVGRNMNRLFSGKPGGGTSGKTSGDAMQQLATQIWGLIKQSKPNLVLTLHESRGFHSDEPKRYGQTFTYDFPALAPRFERVAAKVNAEIPIPKQRFLQFVDPFPTCPTYVTYKYLHAPATSIETAKPLPLARRVALQLVALRGFFREWGLEWDETSSRAAIALPKIQGATVAGSVSGATTPTPNATSPATTPSAGAAIPSATAPALPRS